MIGKKNYTYLTKDQPYQPPFATGIEKLEPIAEIIDC